MTAMMMTTKEQLNSTSPVAALMSSATRWGRATAAIQMTFQVTLNSRIGSIRMGYLSPRNARSDMAVSRQATTPSYTERWGVLDENRPLDDRQSHPHERVAATHEVQTLRR